MLNNKKYFINIEKELKKSYLEYAMSVIIGRALPDVRDGLKPVHRRILYAMYKMNEKWIKTYKKSARIVGDVIGKYHPHGDKAVYDTIVRMAQTFSLRYTLIDGQGNFGSIDGDNAAAMRYTEIRMSKITFELLSDLEKNTVEFVNNYDNTHLIPVVLPTKLPNLLINGSSGIAVGMVTNIPPHNLSEVINACLEYIKNKNITIKKLMKYIPGPDFPTFGIIYGIDEIKKAYKTGKGKIIIRAKIKLQKNLKNKVIKIIINELPYQVNKLILIKKISKLIKNKTLKNIKNLNDESDKDGMRIVIKLKKNAIYKKIIKKLYLLTKLETFFNINMVALYKGQPKLLNLKNILEAFLNHRREIVTRRTIFLLNKIKERIHILEGLIIALINIKNIIKILKKVKTLKEAEILLSLNTWKIDKFIYIIKYSKKNLIYPNWLNKKYIINKKKYFFTKKQIKAILELRLHKLIRMEYHNLINEYKNIIIKSIDLLIILKNSKYLTNIIIEELIYLKKKFGDNRRTIIKFNNYDKKNIFNKNIIFSISYKGYIKLNKINLNIKKIKINYHDLLRCFILINIYEKIILFSNLGFYYLIEVEKFKKYIFKQNNKINNFIILKKNEYIQKILSFNIIKKYNFLIISTINGIIKKINIEEYLKFKSKIKKIIDLDENDKLLNINCIKSNDYIILFTLYGQIIYLNENKIKKKNYNIINIKKKFLNKKDKLIFLIINNEKKSNYLILTEDNYIYKKNINNLNKNELFFLNNKKKIISIIHNINKNYIILITNKNNIFKININNNIFENKNKFLIINKKQNEKIIFFENYSNIKI
ncbi:DNA topoisomerase (ATP-hydrolyzing) subunit A [Enterobacterales bacterium endosymbiont of Anomoneura mori]|uniref:DNA gyrase/topoisomerase IV subunit A n=1 Tax=Enterobacterales bacterium endosymbiont of Anomoneura mori TaxID=3132096 RepID=UPI00399C91D2